MIASLYFVQGYHYIFEKLNMFGSQWCLEAHNYAWGDVKELASALKLVSFMD